MMKTANSQLYNVILIIVDIAVITVSFLMSYYFRVHWDNRPLLDDVLFIDYVFAFLTILPVWIIIFSMLGLYSANIYNRRLVEWSRILVGCFIGILLIIGWEYTTKMTFFPARLVTVYVLFSSFLLIVMGREIVKFIQHMLYSFGYGINNVLLIGNGNIISDINASLFDYRSSGFRVVAISCPKKDFPSQTLALQFSSVEQSLKQIKKLKINTIIQTDLYKDNLRNQKIIAVAQDNHISYNFIPSEVSLYSNKNIMDVFVGYPMITINQTPLIGWGAIAKRVFDTIASFIILVLISPLFLSLIILQKILNNGPIFYVSKRLSMFSKPIDLIKFRSMGAKYGKKDAAEEFREMGREDLAKEYELNRKVENDPRITKFGNFLRKTSLDELPQIINVFKGDLSLVGPRPILPQELKLIKNRASLLHSVKSGVTGLWQVSGRSELSFDDRIELEIFYVQNWTFWLDIKILIKTVKVVLFRTGAK